MPSLVTGQPNRTSTHSMLTSMLASFEITETVKMTGKTLIGHDEAFSSSDMTNLPVKSISIDLTNDNFNQSINQNLCSAPSRSLLRGAPDPGQAEKYSL